jgi:membrane dipeptidase
VQPLFDGHNDVLIRAGADAIERGRGEGHLDVPRMRAGGFGGGLFAIFTPGEEMEVVAHEDAVAHVERTHATLVDLHARGALRMVLSAVELDVAREDDAIAAVLHFEGAEAIDPGLDALDAWFDRGLRSLGLVWSRPNDFGTGVPFAFPSSPDVGPGLTDAGKRLVRRCNELGVLVDLSHLNEAGFWDVARLSDAPLVASHSGAHALAPAARNLTDEQLDAIGESGGLVGIVLAVCFLRADGAEEPDTPLETVVAHARHVADRIGVESVAIGSDFDGTEIPQGIGDATGIPRLLGALRAGGFTEDEIARIAWGNWRRVLGETWKA